MTRISSGFVVHVATVVAVIICGVPMAHGADAPTMDQSQWRDTILKLDTPHEGCFSAAYPETVWHATTCWPVTEHVHPPVARSGAAEAAPNVGNGTDYTLSAPSLISSAVGSFPAVTGVTSETGTGVFGFYDEGILGPNEYSLQLNTNSTGRTAACASGLSDCTVWQQFIYSPDSETKGSAAVFIQYWLLNYGTTCPSGWYSTGDGRCFKDSGYVSAPDVAITSLGSLKLSATVKSGGNDTLTFYDGSAAYAVTAPDSVLDIATVWKQAEFNVFGNADGSQAVFNTGSSVTVKIAAQYGSTTAPSCVAGSGTSSESNNLILQTCAAAGGTAPDIQFVESILGPPPPVPTDLSMDLVSKCPRVVVKWKASAGATSYLVFTASPQLVPPPNPPTVASPIITNTNSILLPWPGVGNELYVWVAAADSLGVSAWSSYTYGKETTNSCP